VTDGDVPDGDVPDADAIGLAPTVEFDSTTGTGSGLSTDASTFESLGSAASLLQGLAAAPGGPAELGPLRPGQVVGGKYRVERAIGAGGMGFVFLARDTRLDRDVAIKVGAALSAAALARIEREAQALARLSHPNVVVVHEVGEVDGRVFVVMEHVAGGTARTWLRDQARTTREILSLYAAAGDGLAAAHAAGIVHRDFKPDNVLVGDDGRPRVADFGLARELGEAAGADEATSSPGTHSPLVDVTRTGAIAGTPAYMAPEQMDGAAVDARADQFALCAALWEALHGTRPFAGTTPREIAAEVASSQPRTARPADGTRRRKVPGHVDAALRRGLRRDPAERWPSLEPLLAELRRDPARRRRKVILFGAAATAIAAAVAIPLTLRGGGHAPCGDDGQAAALWNDARADRIGQAFAASGGATTWAHIRPRIDAYVRALAVARHDACKATRIDGTQSEAILDRRMLCVGAARAQLAQVLVGYEQGGRDAVAHAPQELDLLSDLGECADVAALSRQAPLPADPAVRAAIERAYEEVAAVRNDEVRDAVRDPERTGDHLLATAQATAWPPLIATASSLRAAVLLDADRREVGRKALADAISAELAAGDDEGAARSMVDLALDYARQRDSDEAEHWLQLARPLWQRTGGDPGIGIRLLFAEATWDIARGKLKEAVEVGQRQLALTRKAYGDDPFEVGVGHLDLALAYTRAGWFRDGEREARLALTSIEAALGKDHPLVSKVLDVLASDEMKLGELDAAHAHFRRAVAIFEAWYGPDDPHLATPLADLGQLEAVRGDEHAARAAYDRAIAISKAHDVQDADIADYETNVGVMLTQFGHLADARPYADRGLAGHLRKLGPDHPDLNSDYILLAYLDRSLGRLADAEREGREAVRVIEKAFGANDPNAINPRIELSYTLVKAGKAGEAVALLEPMVALAERNHQVQPPAAAEVHTAYADALWRAHGDRARARAAALKGRDAFAALGAGYDDQRKQAETWLTAHPMR